MREIKFRAWNGENMFYEEKDIITPYRNQQIANFLNDVYGCELMQYTGLKDKNGKEIYEGDIFLNGESKRIIEFIDGNYHAIKPNRKEAILLSFIASNPKNIVIGNIYENPELL